MPTVSKPITHLFDEGTSFEWGVPQKSTYGTLRSYSARETAKSSEMPNEEGNTVALTVYDKKTEISLSVYAKQGAEPPKPGDVVTASDGKKIIVTDASKSWENEGRAQIEMSGTIYPLIKNPIIPIDPPNPVPPPEPAPEPEQP